MPLTNYNILTDPYYQQFCIERNLKSESRRHYKKALNKYCQYHQMTLTELYDEADAEEEQGVREKNRNIVQRLRGFRTYLIQEGYSTNTINHYYSCSKAFYTHFLIQVPYIPSVKLNHKQVSIHQIPSKDDIIECLQHTNNLKHRAIIYFMCASGTARQEICNITIQDFIDATSEYHNSTQIYEVVQTLEEQDNIIPVFEMVRQKTNYRYYTLITDEATRHLLRYLRSRPLKRLRPTQSLFDIKPNSITIFFQRLNTSCGYPPHYLHPHSLRKYHTDIIDDWDLTNRLQGRKSNAVREAYDKVNPTKLKQKYMKHLEDLTLQPSKVVTIESDEVKELKRQHKAEIKRLEDETKARVQAIEDKIALFLKLQQK